MISANMMPHRHDGRLSEGGINGNLIPQPLPFVILSHVKVACYFALCSVTHFDLNL